MDNSSSSSSSNNNNNNSNNNNNKLVLLHGDLDLFIIEARDLPNKDLFTENLRRCFASCGLCIGPANSRSTSSHPNHKPKIITSDPYVTVSLAGATVARTGVLPNEENPYWNEHFVLPLAHHTTHIEFQVKDNDVLGAQVIGTALVPAAPLLSGAPLRAWFPVLTSSGHPPKPNTALLLSMTFTPAVGAVRQPLGVPGTYFPERKGGEVTLYQDAHVREGELPEIELDGGRVFEHRRCWEDICHAILDAHRLIYIAGWSIYDKVRLVREGQPLPKEVPETLGELLKYKSQEGVRVCLLVWDDKTSHDRLFLKTEGVMQTHDEETRKFFKHSSVICALSPRYGSSKLSIIKQQVVGTLFTHHQKCLLVDSPTTANNRKITAFIGGLDICDGRYDTPQHRLFCDLNTVFLNDIRNPTFPGETNGPRQPWHDLHCKIEGPAAYDVLKNFEQRWRKATKRRVFKQGLKRVSHWHDDSLIKLERMSWIVSPDIALHDNPSLWVTKEEDFENWHVQIFRSIDSGSINGFHTLVHEAEAQNLVCGKNLVIDKSIHTAYVKAIRSAQHFIYIENQYFIGSSYAWPSYKSAEAGNLIPMELALKIASKIRARERFAVYVVIPMWPEGVPTSGPTQEILFWQGQTIEMMYRIIAQELKSMLFENANPQDYLNFYCLGNREELPSNASESINEISKKSTAVLSQKFRRFMIYVHSKGMIVDDEYVILGSANINQRSLDGSRDTEIAMGAYQPHYTWTEQQTYPRGQVYGYRMSLWAEHLDTVDAIIKEPHTLDCVKFVNLIAEQNWTRYTTEQIVPLKGHLLKYPIKVERDGMVKPLPGHDAFPDVGGKVLGEQVPTLPDNLTM